MSGIEWMIVLFLGLPIVFLCGVFVVLACRLQKEEEMQKSAPVQGEATSY